MIRDAMRLPIQHSSSVSGIDLRRLCLIALGLLLGAAVPECVRGVEAPWVMEHDPVLKRAPVERAIPPGLVDRWLEALARPEREMKRRVALAIPEAVAKDVPGLEATIGPLCKRLGDSDEDRIVRLTAARALVALEARQAAPLLIEAAGPNDLEMAEIVEPALARWRETGLRERWMRRLDSEIGLRRLHVLAIRGLTALGSEESLPRLLEIAVDGRGPADVRLEAARALGVMRDSGLLEAATGLSADAARDALVDRLVAAEMLASHRGEDAEELLAVLATDPQPSVRAVALRHLFAIDPGLILPIIEETANSKDAKVRRWGAKTLVAKATPERLAILGPMLDDRDPELRTYVCDRLVELSEDAALRESVIVQGRRVLNEDGWRGQEQATLLLVTLEDKTIVERLLELLEVSRPEANVAAAWGLCELAVPSTAEPAHGYLRRKTESWLDGEPSNGGLSDQMALLSQLMGVLKHTAAEPVLRKYIPKATALSPTSRAAAIWALGHFHAGKADAELARLLEARMLDAFSEMEPESIEVSRMSAVALGRMEAAKRLPALRRTLNQASLDSSLGYAAAWAIKQLTGEEIPPLSPNIYWEQDWFLIPSSGR